MRSVHDRGARVGLLLYAWCMCAACAQLYEHMHDVGRAGEPVDGCAGQHLLYAQIHMDLAPWRRGAAGGVATGVTFDLLNASVYEAHQKSPSGIYTSTLVVHPPHPTKRTTLGHSALPLGSCSRWPAPVR
jgi:hypothetical protein